MLLFYAVCYVTHVQFVASDSYDDDVSYLFQQSFTLFAVGPTCTDNMQSTEMETASKKFNLIVCVRVELIINVTSIFTINSMLM